MLFTKESILFIAFTSPSVFILMFFLALLSLKQRYCHLSVSFRLWVQTFMNLCFSSSDQL